MTDRDAFLAAIREQPDNDLPRLVYADWLAEHDEPERAEFIRVQCELAKIPSPPPTRQWNDPRYSCGSRWGELRQRERELWTAGGHGALPVGIIPTLTFDYFGRLDSHAPALFRRGFVAELQCSWPACRDHLDAIRQEHPVESVHLNGEMPGIVGGSLHGAPTGLDGDPANMRFDPVTIEGKLTPDDRNIHAFTRRLTLGLLRCRWPGIRFTLPSEPARPAVDPDDLRRAIEAAAERESPGYQIEWVTQHFTDETLRQPFLAIAHFDCGAYPAFRQSLVEARRRPSAELLPSPVELRRQAFALDPQTRQVVYVYRGQCPDCRTTFLALGRP